MKQPTISERVLRADELAHRARVHLDLWLALTLDRLVKPYEAPIDEYYDFFRFTQSAHEAAFITRIANLLQRHPQTENLPDLIKAGRKIRNITPEAAAACEQELIALDAVFKSVKHIRDNALAHQSRALSQPEVYQAAPITLNMMVDLSDRVIGLTRVLVRDVGLQPRVPYAQPSVVLQRMLSDLDGLMMERNRVDWLNL